MKCKRCNDKGVIQCPGCSTYIGKKHGCAACHGKEIVICGVCGGISEKQTRLKKLNNLYEKDQQNDRFSNLRLYFTKWKKMWIK